VNNATNSRGIGFLDEIASQGRASFTVREFIEAENLSPSAASNRLSRLRAAGFVDRIGAGSYVIRPIGRLGTRASAEDVALAVGSAFEGRKHRIAFRSALDHHDLLINPAKTIQVAVETRGSLKTLSGRRLKQISETNRTIDIGSEDAGYGARVSCLERALIESASRMNLSGGPAVLAHAIRSSKPDIPKLLYLAEEMKADASVRRLASIAEQIGANFASRLDVVPKSKSYIHLDSRERDAEAFRDRKWKVIWPEFPDSMI